MYLENKCPQRDYTRAILIAILASFVPMVVPMRWYTLLIYWLIIIGAFVWLIALTPLKKLLRNIILSCAIIALGFDAFYGVKAQWVKDHPSAAIRTTAGEGKPVSSPISQGPNLGASLVIDAVSKEHIDFHILLNNAAGSTTLNNIRYNIKTSDAGQNESISPMNRTLQPGRDLTIQPIPFILATKEYNHVILTITYVIDDDGAQRECNSKYLFVFSLKQANKGNVIYPESSNNIKINGDMINRSHENDILFQLSNEKGTIVLVIDERKADGSFNKVFYSAGKKSILFDPECRIVSFTFTVNGQEKTVKQPLEGKPHRHDIIVTWSDRTGGYLYIDGKEAK